MATLRKPSRPLHPAGTSRGTSPKGVGDGRAGAGQREGGGGRGGMSVTLEA